MSAGVYDWKTAGVFADVPEADADVPSQVSGDAVRRCLVALASGRMPAIRTLKQALGVSQARAVVVQGWLRHLRQTADE